MSEGVADMLDQAEMLEAENVSLLEEKNSLSLSVSEDILRLR